ncbi:MAG: M23 family metallopeptidase [Anaerolineae bacterium]|nr:M23 family metallopeptidase [Anaerolineae bacterium]
MLATFDQCAEGSPSCGQAYGNWLLMEHVLLVQGNAQIWHTGYAHLSQISAQAGQWVLDIRQAIAASGATGSGGPHLHVEVRNPRPGTPNWVDPWDNRQTGQTLWIMAQGEPLAASEWVAASGP